MRLLRVWFVWTVGTLLWLASANLASAEQPQAGAQRQTSEPAASPGSVGWADRDEAPWCAPELTPLSQSVCYYSPSASWGDGTPPRPDNGSLVVFLHSLVSAAPRAAWEQQLRMRRLADTYGFSMLVPRGRPGFGPGRDPEVLAWPTAQALQASHEDELLGEWNAAIEQVKALGGKPQRIFLFGFSNGAYYATSLVFREKFTCDGAALFAGGSGSKYQRLTAQRAKRRIPLFVAYGTLDPDNPQQRSLVTLLKQLAWPHRSLAAKVGHTVASEQLRAALRFLGHPGLERDP